MTQNSKFLAHKVLYWTYSVSDLESVHTCDHHLTISNLIQSKQCCFGPCGD
jgi:hypothetical protein